MPTTYPERPVSQLAAKLLQCLRDEVQLSPSPNAVVGFRTGTTGQPLAGLTEDECCDGAAFVRVVRTYPSWGVPAPALTSMSCAQPHGVVFELSIWRCSPIGDISEPPVQQAWNDLHQELLNDRLTMLSAICCLQAQLDQRTIMIGEWAPVNTDGGCVGSTVTLDVDIYKGT